MNDILNEKVELLSPAGNFECFLSAIKNGADAVYLAGDKFGARAYAGNFSKEEILKALDIAHLFNKKIYLTVNTVIKESEIGGLYDYLLPFYERGLDGVIVQDIGVLSLLSKMFPSLSLHASTQMSITSAKGVELLKKLGVERVVPARELSLNEIKDIYKETGMELETFIHGSMCYAYSGKCLFSSFLGGRSGNRGRCAQPCRLKYNGVYPLSMKDMYTLRILPKLIDAGIKSFKIEGRMKSAEYVSVVTGIYRKYIDLYYSDPNNFHYDDKDEKLLLDVYTRSGNCEGYYFKRNGKDMITMNAPGYNGEKSDLERISLYTDKKLSGKSIQMYADCLLGKPLTLTIGCEDTYITVSGDNVESAVSKPTTIDTISEKLSKLGNTYYTLDNISVNCDDNIFIPVGKLNELRREGINRLTKELLKDYYRFDAIKPQEDDTEVNTTAADDTIAVTANSIEMVKMLLDYKEVLEIIIPSYLFYAANDKKEYVLNQQLVGIIKEYGQNKRIIISLPKIIRDNSVTILKELINLATKHNIYGLMVSNYESLQSVVDSDFAGRVICDEHMYAANNESINTLRRLGADYLTYPVELTIRECRDINLSNAYLIVYGKMPLMISSNCTVKTLSGCRKEMGFTYLNDRKGADFPVLNICSECTNIIYNSVPTYIDTNTDAFKRQGAGLIRIDFTDETISEAKKILEHFVNSKIRPSFEYTKGHFVKGVE